MDVRLCQKEGGKKRGRWCSFFRELKNRESGREDDKESKKRMGGGRRGSGWKRGKFAVEQVVEEKD